MPGDTTRPRPTPPPGRTAALRPAREGLAPGTSHEKPLTGAQFVRLQALRVATDMRRGTRDATEQQLCRSADRLIAYILTGKIPTEGP